MAAQPRVEQLVVSAHIVPTEVPEADGTLSWDETVLVTVQLASAGVTGFGYTYADLSTARLIETRLGKIILGSSAWDIDRNHRAMFHALRNLGQDGIGAMGLSALDIALWDLKARLLGVPMLTLLGGIRNCVEIYASGGFTSYGHERLVSQLGGWRERGIAKMKIKIGSDPRRDHERVYVARDAIGVDCELFVDANGAYERKQALAQAHWLAAQRVSWLEEPVSSDDLVGLGSLVSHAPPSLEIAAGEYGYNLSYFQRMLQAQAVDVLQADATRCGGITGFMNVARLAELYQVPLSSHCAPALHVHLGCAAGHFRHLEYFHDHVRIEDNLFEGVPLLDAGRLSPVPSRPGLGIELRRAETERFFVGSATLRPD